MAADGFEWVNDWYDPNYYEYSTEQNPTGPEKPVFKNYSGKYTKVLRSLDRFNGITGTTVGRHYDDPSLSEHLLPSSFTARCVVNSPSPINK